MLSQLTMKKIAIFIGFPLLVYGLLQYMRYPVVSQAENHTTDVQSIKVVVPTHESNYGTPQVVTATAASSSDSLTNVDHTDKVVDINNLTFSEAVKHRMRQTLGRNLYEYTDDRTVKPFVDGIAVYRVASRYNLGTCTVTKVLTTLLANAICYLFDTDAFLESNSTITGRFFSGNPCTRRNSFWSIEELRGNITEKVDILFVARDPTERFLSGFVDKCVNEVRPGQCFDCNGDMECFLIQFRALLRIIQRDRKSSRFFAPTTSRKFHELLHFTPQTWFCDMRQNFEDYHFIKYGNSGDEQVRMRDQFGSILRNHSIPEEKVRYVLDGMKDDKRTKHATVHSPARDDYQRKLFESPILYSMLENLYKPDYELFGFEKPSETRRRQIKDGLQ